MTSNFYYKNNRLSQIRGFCYTVQKGSIVKAADFLGLTQPAITIQINSLERDLKVKLFKNTKPLQLTQAGQKFYDMSIIHLRGIESLYDKFVQEQEEQTKNTLNIAGHHSAFTLILPQKLQKLQKLYPNIKLTLSYLQKTQAFSDIINNKIDIGLYPLEEEYIEYVPKELKIIKILKYKPVVLFARGNPLQNIPDKEITFEDIGRNNNFLHTGKYAISDIMQKNIKSGKLKTNIFFQNGSWEMMKALVEQGLGVTIFHEGYIKKEENIIYKEVSHLSPNINYFLIIRKGEYLKQNVTDLIKLFMC